MYFFLRARLTGKQSDVQKSFVLHEIALLREGALAPLIDERVQGVGPDGAWSRRAAARPQGRIAFRRPRQSRVSRRCPTRAPRDRASSARWLPIRRSPRRWKG